MKTHKLLAKMPVVSSRTYTALLSILTRSHEPPEPNGWPGFSAPINTKADLRREIINGNVAKARYVGPQTFKDICMFVGLDPAFIKGKRQCPKCGTLV